MSASFILGPHEFGSLKRVKLEESSSQSTEEILNSLRESLCSIKKPSKHIQDITKDFSSSASVYAELEDELNVFENSLKNNEETISMDDLTIVLNNLLNELSKNLYTNKYLETFLLSSKNFKNVDDIIMNLKSSDALLLLISMIHHLDNKYTLLPLSLPWINSILTLHLSSFTPNQLSQFSHIPDFSTVLSNHAKSLAMTLELSGRLNLLSSEMSKNEN